MSKITMIACLSAATFAVLNCFAGDDIAAVQAAMLADKEATAARVGIRAKASSTRLLSAQSDNSSVTYTATGDLDNVVGSGNLNFRFVVDKPFTQITSAKLEINAYDVDHPSANEHDKVYFNGSFIGRLKGVNGAYEVNTFNISPNLIKCPTTDGATAANTFSVAVNVDNGGWVTGVGWAKLTISGETFKLTASKNDSRGIMLKWTDLGGRYEVWRLREKTRDTWDKVDTDILACEYLDSNVQYGLEYRYRAIDITKSKMVSNVATGYMGKSIDIPKITGIDVGELWLAGRGPYWCALEWNKFDSNLYAVTRIAFDITDKYGEQPYSLAPFPTSLHEDDDVTLFDLWDLGYCIPNGKHGKYKLSVSYWYKNKVTGESTKITNGAIFGDVRVFFEKFKHDDNYQVNWYTYWKRDGAIKMTYRGYDFVYDIGENALGRSSGKPYYQSIEHKSPNPSKFPDVEEFLSSSVRFAPCKLGTDAPTRGGRIKANGQYTGPDVGEGDLKGIHALAAVMVHEAKHNEVREDVYKNHNGWIFIDGKNKNGVGLYSFDDIYALLAALNQDGYGNPLTTWGHSQKYYDAVKNAAESGMWISDFDGDHVRDDYEANGRYYQKIVTSSLKSDTYNFAYASGWPIGSKQFEQWKTSYERYGDDEIIARTAEKEETKPYVAENADWAWPGSQIGREFQELRFGYVSGEWTSERRISETAKKQRIGRRSGRLLVGQSASMRTLRSASNRAMAVNENADEDYRLTRLFHGRLSKIPEMVSITGAVHLIEYSCPTLCRTEQDDVGIMCNLSLTNETDAAVSLKVKCYFTDAHTNALSWIATNVICEVGKTDVSLLSPLDDIVLIEQPSRLMLYSVSIEEVNGDVSDIFSEQIVCAMTEREFLQSDLAKTSGYICRETIMTDISASGIVISGQVVRASNDVGRIYATLTDTNGLMVASEMIDAPASGTNGFSVAFSGQKLYNIAKSPPYIIASLRLEENNATVHDITNLGMLDFKDTSTFRTSDMLLYAVQDSGRWCEPVLSTDGLIDQIVFSFAVSNSADSVILCDIQTSLVGTNEALVCSTQFSVNLQSGFNSINVPFPSFQLMNADYEGGVYRVDNIIIEDQDENKIEVLHANGNSITINKSDLGGVPFSVSGDAICRTGNVYKPIVVEVPIDVMRAGDITASAIVTDTNGEFVVRSETNLTVAVGNGQTVAIEFNARDLMSTGIPGPYMVHYLVLRSGYEGVEEVRIEDFSAIVEYTPTLYVNAQTGSDDGDGLSDGTALRTIQAALDFASDGAVINVGAGDYICHTEIEGETFLNVNKKVTIIASGSDPSETRIVGPRGGTTNDVRGVWLAEGATLSGFTITNFLMSAGGGVGIYGEGLGAVVSNCVIAGCSATHDGGGVYQCTVFDSTIRNCRAQNGGGAAQSTLIRCLLDGNTATQYGGGVAYGAATNCVIRNGTATNGGGGSAYATVVDCLIEKNKTSNYGGGVYQGCSSRCTIRRNISSAYGGGMRQGTADNCVFFENRASGYGGGTYATTLTNCTVIGNVAISRGGGVYNGVVVNSIIWGNTAATSNNHYLAQGVYNCTTPLLPGDGNIDADPCLRGADFGGFMLAAGSPCLDAGLDDGETAGYVYSGAANQLVAKVSAKDFFGNERTQGAHVDMGAVEGVTNACLVMTRTVGGGSVDVSFELVEPHSSLTITADESVRPIDRFEMHDGRIFTSSPVMLEDITSDVFLTAYFKYYDFYVNAQNGEDVNDGLSWASAKRTIQAAIDCAVDGEKIWVAKGTYEPIVTNDKTIEIEAVEGALLTSIDGGGTNRCATLATSGSMASKTNTVLVGFTLTNGRATQGAGAYGGTLKDCIIKSNTADGSTYCYGGGSYYGVQYGCRYERNSVSATGYGYGGAAYYGTSYNCSYVNNSVYGVTNAYGGGVYYGAHYDCGLTNNTSSSNGGAAYGGTWYRASVSKNRANHGGGFYYGSVYESTISGNRSSGDGGGANRTSLIGCMVVNNQAGGSGGGALLTDYTATRTVFKNNIARGSGGGVYGGTCNYCGITNNTASSNGGGAYNITASRTSFFGNSAATGGGVYNGTYNSCTIEGNTSSGEGGGAYSGTFYDSLIANNDSNGVGGGLSRGTFHRTKITGNRSNSDGGGVYNGTGYNSLIVKNKGLGNGGGTYSGYNYSCTITENWCGGNGGGTCNGYQYNSIIVDNADPDGEYNRYSGSIYNCFATNDGDPMFVNPSESDYRLRVASPCINAGNNSYANGSTDIALATRIQGGKIDMGAYEGGVEGFIITVDSVGVGDLEYGSSLVTNGGSFAISASSTGRTFLHFKTNGVVATTAPTLTLDGITRDVKVTAEFVHEMFVDGANGADDNDGLSWSSAKKSIQAAIDASVDSDTIWVADGVYEPIVSTKRIDIVSINGAGKTFIDGKNKRGCATLDSTWLKENHTGTRLSGFTIRNGNKTNGAGVQFGMVDNCIIENCHATGHGGGIDFSTISNCIIRNNTAQDYGGGLAVAARHRIINCKILGNVAATNGGGESGDGKFLNCVFINNIAGGNGGAMYNGTAYDSTFTGNRASAGGATCNGTFYRCSLSDNTSTGEGGGAYSGTFYDSVISNNTASGVGGGLSRGTFHRSHVVGNMASGDGGGVYNGTGYNSIIARNKTNGSGGGTYSGNNYNCTITENYSALSGGGTYSGYRYNSIIWNNHNAYGEYNCEGGGSQYNCHTSDPMFVNAGESDYRLRAGSPCINAGNASYVNGSKDVALRTRVLDGTVDIGAHEGAVNGFVVKVKSPGGATISHSSALVASNGTFTILAVNSGRPFTSILTNGVMASSTVPFTLTGITSDVELTVYCIHDIYVDVENGDDANSGFSREAAKQSIQAAIDISLPDDVIHVADGYYRPFASGNKDILIKSDNGPDNCIVDGEYSARCATLGESPSEVQTTVDGLTFCNGYSSAGGGCYYGTVVNCIIEDCYSTGDGGGVYGTLLKDCTIAGNVANSNGGGAYGNLVRAWRCSFVDNVSYGSGGGAYSGSHYDSTFEGNRAYSYGGAAYGSILQRCVLHDNQASTGGGTYNGTMYSCLYYDNYASSSVGGAYYGTLYNCTLTRNKAASSTGGMYYSTAYNTISRNNRLNSGAINDSYGSSYYNCCLSSSSGSNTVVADPLFFDAANDDFRLSMNSPCLNMGDNSRVAESTDLLGKPRTQDGTVDIGCYEGPMNIWQINVVACGRGTVLSSGTSVMDGGAISFTAVEEGYPFLGFYTNGVFATSEKSFIWKNVSSHGTIEAWFKQNIYVDASKPDDSGDGSSWDTARKNLSMVVAEVSNGANIWVKSGTYTPIVTDNKKITITAVDGSAATAIDGGGTDCCVYAYTNNVSVSMMTNTVVVGFTLKNGYALQGGGAYGGTLRQCVIESNNALRYGGGTYYGVQQDCAYSNNFVEGTSVARGGAAYYGTSYNCTYEGNSVTSESTADGGAIFGGVHYDCTIINNTSSYRGGGICNATCYRCVLTGNKAQMGGASYAGSLRDCLIVGNGAADLGGGSYSTTLIGCTVAGNTSGDAGGVYIGTVRNSIIWGNCVTNGVSTNCVSATLMYTCTDSIDGEVGCITDDPRFVDAENGDYRLLPGSPCIDAGNNSYLSSLSTYDVAHKNRIINSEVDMGCYEGAFSGSAETQGTPEPVPHSWLDGYTNILSSHGGDYEVMANAPSPGANGAGKTWPDGSPCYVWQDFVAGTSPTNDTVFTATIRMEGNTPVITWEPDTPELRATRVYKTLGKKTLMDKDWVDVTDKDQSEYHFFRVTVDMP